MDHYPDYLAVYVGYSSRLLRYPLSFSRDRVRNHELLPSILDAYSRYGRFQFDRSDWKGDNPISNKSFIFIGFKSRRLLFRS